MDWLTVEVAEQRSWVRGVHYVQELDSQLVVWILELGLHGVVLICAHSSRGEIIEFFDGFVHYFTKRLLII